MSDDDKPPMPKQPTTTQMPAVPDWAIEIKMAVTEGISSLREDVSEVKGKVGKLEGDVTLLVANGQTANDRLSRMEYWRDRVEERLHRNSDRARTTSQVDLGHDAAIAEVKTDLAAVKEDVGAALVILKELAKIQAHPLVRKIAYGVGLLIVGWLASKGIK